MGVRIVSFLIRGVGGFTPLPPGPLPPFRALSGGKITTTESFLFLIVNKCMLQTTLKHNSSYFFNLCFSRINAPTPPNLLAPLHLTKDDVFIC